MTLVKFTHTIHTHGVGSGSVDGGFFNCLLKYVC